MPRLVIKKGTGVGRDHVLGGSACVIGRDPQVTFSLEDHLASRRHCQVVSEGGAWHVEDLGSTNGTFVNGGRVEREQLRDGDVIRAGTTELTFVQKDLWGSEGGEASAKQKLPPAPVRRRRKLR